MGKKKDIDRIDEFLSKQTGRKSKNFDKSVKYRAKHSYPTTSGFSKEYVDEYGLNYSVSYGKKSDMWYEEEKSERLNPEVTDTTLGKQYFFIKANKDIRESGAIPDIYSNRTLTDKKGNKILITVIGVNISPRRATGELFADNVKILN